MIFLSRVYVLDLTLNVRGSSNFGSTRSISWLLMSWLLTSPGHQQPWYWLCRIGRFLSYLRTDLNCLRRINVEKWQKWKYLFIIPLKKLARKGLIRQTFVPYWFSHFCTNVPFFFACDYHIDIDNTPISTIMILWCSHKLYVIQWRLGFDTVV